ncbi:hypothetical protein [Breoghania sp.]|uniref:hypothetical protein n=1 Tax=Breoghania sp. TaxID=2065378 RepID=UPI00261B97D0|nr:hypothetical protein [Breoghania sp.]
MVKKPADEVITVEGEDVPPSPTASARSEASPQQAPAPEKRKKDARKRALGGSNGSSYLPHWRSSTRPQTLMSG